MNGNTIKQLMHSHAVLALRVLLLLLAAVFGLTAYGNKDLPRMAISALLGLMAFAGAGNLPARQATISTRADIADLARIARRYPHRMLAFVAVVSSALAALIAAADPLSLVAVAAWALGIVLIALAATSHDKWADRSGYRAQFARILRDRAMLIEILLVGLLTLVAFALRGYDTAHFPANMHGDEAESAFRGLRVLIGPPLPPFIVSYDWYQLPTLFHYIEATSMAVFGISEGGVRMSSAIFGALSVPLLYLTARLAWGRVYGYAAAILMTASHLHIQYSRMGGGYIHPSTMMVLMAFLMVVADRGSKRMIWMAGIGLTIGLSQYFYSSARLLPLVAAPMLVALLARRKIEWRHIAVVAIAVFVSLSPLLLFYAQKPDSIAGRATDVFLLTPASITHTLGEGATLQKDIGRLIDLQLRRVFGFFVSGGDAGGKYTVAFSAFDGVTAILMWLGIGVALTRPRRFGELLTLVWFALGVTSAGLLTIDAPTGNRLMAFVPAVYLFGGLIVGRVTDALAGNLRMRPERVGLPLVAALALYVFPTNVNTYFVRYPAITENMQPIMVARELSKVDPATTRAYALTLPTMYPDYAPIKFLAYRVKAEELPDAKDLKPASDGRSTFIVALANRFDELDQIKRQFPNGKETSGIDQRGQLILRTYLFPAP